MGNISSQTWQMLQQRHSEYLTHSAINTLLNTTHIVGFRENAQQINRMVCNLLPVPNNKFLISQAVDFINSTQSDISFSENLPSCVRLQPSARIRCTMFIKIMYNK